MRDHDPETADAISDAPRIIAFRNTLIHGYDLIDYVLVWDVIRNKLPILQREILALMGLE